MKFVMKTNFFPILLAFLLFSTPCRAIELAVTSAAAVAALAPDCKAAFLMESSTGQSLFEKNPDEQLPIASVTKIMTMLLAMEAIDNGSLKYDEMLTTSEHASSMGGSQIYLEIGEQISVSDCLKGIAVASGNDAAVVMGERLAGNEAMFVNLMNERAASLGMQNTHFINTNGLDEGDEGHSSARDVAIMSRELLKHRDIVQYLTIWTDSLRDGQFDLANTNKLVRFYSGTTGIKTGSTSAAGYCLSASAQRDGMELIAVVLGANTTANRFANATSLLDFGFATYSVIKLEDLGEIKVNVEKGKSNELTIIPENLSGIVVPKSKVNKLEKAITLPESVQAKIKEGEKIGEISFVLENEVLATADLIAQTSINKMNIFEWIGRMLESYIV